MTEIRAADPGRQAIIDALERHEVDYLVIGATAAAAPRLERAQRGHRHRGGDVADQSRSFRELLGARSTA